MGHKTMIWMAVVVAAAAAVLALTTRRTQRKTVVLGQQEADAQANEAARIATGDVGPSPMPKGKYDQERGDYDLASVTVLPLDSELQNVVRAFKGRTPEHRGEVRGRISMDELYTLIHFAKRSSVLAIREKSAARCEEGLIALAMIDETRVDPRDAAWAAGLLGHAIEATGAKGESLVDQATSLARPEMSRILAHAKDGSRLSDWGYTEIRTEEGTVGFLRSGDARYEPTFDMTGLALRLGANLRRGRYIAEPELATDVPSVWFEKMYRSDAEQLLRRARAAISVTGTLRKAYTAKPFAQLFVQWVVEMPTAEEAEALGRCVGTNGRLSSPLVIGLTSGRLFSLLVAGSAMEGVDSYESLETLSSIVNETRALLETAAH